MVRPINHGNQIMPQQNISINYIEFPAVDMESTKQFYGAAFGWEFIDYGPDYVSFSGAGVDGGFTMESEVSGASGVLVVLYHSDLEKIEQKVKELGCEVVKPIFDFPGGRRFHFLDPNGNELAIWSE
jgi:predicted enzyme related to lactoylglutathione lyase